MKGYILIIGALVVIMSVLITLNIFFQQSLETEIADQFSRQQSLLSTAIADNIKTYLRHEKQDLLLISRLLAEKDIKTREDFLRLKFDREQEGVLRTSYGLLDSKGGLIFFKGDKKAPKTLITDIRARMGKMRPDASFMIETPDSLYIIAPVYREEELLYINFLGALKYDIADNFISFLQHKAKGRAWMMDNKGNLLYHPSRPDMVGKNLYRADASCFKCHVSFDLEKKILDGKTSGLNRHIAPYGENKIIAFSKAEMDGISWIIAVSIPYSEVTSATKQSMTLYSYLIISIFLTTGIISAAMIVSNKKRIKAEEKAKREEALEKYASELESKVEERTAELIHSEKLASLGRLAAGFAHEIGNPMTSIFSFAQILAKMETDPFKKKSIDTIRFHVNRVSEILKQLSGFSKRPSGEVSECNVNEIIENSVNLVRYDKRAKDIIFEKELSPSLPPLIIDGSQLSQVTVNLVLNAVDAMPEGGTLTVESRAEAGSIVVRVRDTGMGIKKEDIPKIFDPFYTTKEKGTGLGLAVSYDLVKKMNGSLTAASDEGAGSIFTITIPYENDETDRRANAA
ncbi:MAG TPA: hypothetical protein DHV16_02110 [Nitrospiraceae bacterium]|nr:MAG: hypothetical protein A2X55_00540 [Nitrospirae bacterium GWB2_47_37]HAK89906.1 hypothetical protein [Nitrospiraceae bacterium]HCZ11056.1 hypothetical protein [Nitrospiraceae bacterium]